MAFLGVEQKLNRLLSYFNVSLKTANKMPGAKFFESFVS